MMPTSPASPRNLLPGLPIAGGGQSAAGGGTAPIPIFGPGGGSTLFADQMDVNVDGSVTLVPDPALAEQLQQTNDTTALLHGDAATFNQNFSDFNHQLATVHDDAAAFEQHFADFNGQMTVVNRNWSGTNRSLQMASEQWGQTNDTLAVITDPVDLGILMASAGAGLVVGSAVARVAVSALQVGARKLYELVHECITHRRRNDRLIQAFEAAVKQYDNLMATSLQLEDSIRRLLAKHGELEGAGCGFSIAAAQSAVGSSLGHLRVRELQSGKAFEAALAANDPSAADCYRDVIESKAAYARLEGVHNALASCPHEDLRGLIRAQYNTLLALEGQLWSLRGDMLAAKKEWLRRARKELESSNQDYDRVIRDARSICRMGKRWARNNARRQNARMRHDYRAAVGAYRNPGDGSRLGREDARRQLESTLPRGETGQSAGHFLDNHRAAVRRQRQRLDDAFQRSAAMTLQHAPLLRSSPEQCAEVALAQMEHHFERIEADQRAFNCDGPTTDARKVSRGRLLRPQTDALSAVPSTPSPRSADAEARPPCACGDSTAAPSPGAARAASPYPSRPSPPRPRVAAGCIPWFRHPRGTDHRR